MKNKIYLGLVGASVAPLTFFATYLVTDLTHSAVVFMVSMVPALSVLGFMVFWLED